jgi:hypothetical protein
MRAREERRKEQRWKVRFGPFVKRMSNSVSYGKVAPTEAYYFSYDCMVMFYCDRFYH